MGSIELLRAVADQQVTQRHNGSIQGRTYDHHGELITYMELHRLKQSGWILLPLSGPPVVTLDGTTWLREHG